MLSARRKRSRLKAAYLILERKNLLLEDLPPRLPPSRSFDTSGLGVPSAPGPFYCERHPERIGSIRGNNARADALSIIAINAI